MLDVEKIVYVYSKGKLGVIKEEKDGMIKVSLLDSLFLAEEVPEEDLLRVKFTKQQLRKIAPPLEKMMIEHFATIYVRKQLNKEEIKEKRKANLEGKPLWEQEGEAFKSEKLKEYFKEKGYDLKANIPLEEVKAAKKYLFGQE